MLSTAIRLVLNPWFVTLFAFLAVTFCQETLAFKIGKINLSRVLFPSQYLGELGLH